MMHLNANEEEWIFLVKARQDSRCRDIDIKIGLDKLIDSWKAELDREFAIIRAKAKHSFEMLLSRLEEVHLLAENQNRELAITNSMLTNLTDELKGLTNPSRADLKELFWGDTKFAKMWNSLEARLDNHLTNSNKQEAKFSSFADLLNKLLSQLEPIRLSPIKFKWQLSFFVIVILLIKIVLILAAIGIVFLLDGVSSNVERGLATIVTFNIHPIVLMAVFVCELLIVDFVFDRIASSCRWTLYLKALRKIESSFAEIRDIQKHLGEIDARLSE